VLTDIRVLADPFLMALPNIIRVLGVGMIGVDASAIPDWIWVSSGVVVMKPSPRVVHVIWPTVNVRPSATAAEAGTMTILFVRRAVRTPPTWRATIDES